MNVSLFFYFIKAGLIKSALLLVFFAELPFIQIFFSTHVIYVLTVYVYHAVLFCAG